MSDRLHRFFALPLWSVGFRPFFALAALAGAVLPLWWTLALGGQLMLPQTRLSAVQWHAHEMFYGFGWAVLAGFLLTATRNWLRIAGVSGAALCALALAWGLERVALAAADRLPALVFWPAANLFLVAVVLVLVWALWRHRDRDAFRDNYFFLLVLPAFLLAKNLLLLPEHFQLGWTMSLGLFRMAFLVMLERTLTQFMRAAFATELPRRAGLDHAIKLSALALVLAELWWPPLTIALAATCATLLFYRWCCWSPRLGMSRLDIGVMYVGYLAIVVQLVLDALQRAGLAFWIGALPLHVFSFGAMGLIIPAMIVRISNGHTGRRVVFAPADKAALGLMLLALVLRLLLPQLAPAHYLLWMQLAAICWLLCFASLGARYLPYYLAPRVD